MTVVEQRERGRPRVGPPAANLPSSGRRRSKQSVLTLPAELVAAVDRELDGMVGMTRAELYRRVIASELGRPSGPGRRWRTGMRRGRPRAGEGRVVTERVSVALGWGQVEALEARATRLWLVEGSPVSRDEVVGRMLKRWLARRK